MSGRLGAACPTICRRCASKRGRRPPRRSLCCGASRICGVTAKDRRRHRSIARTIAAIEQFDGLASVSADAWAAATGDDKAARAAIKKWRQMPKLDSLSPEELNDLVRSEEHTSELQSLMRISYAVFCLKKKKITR